MPDLIAFDTSIVVGMLDEKDVWHSRALELKVALAENNLEEVFFDCVLAEAISTFARRFHEKRRSGNFNQIIESIRDLFPERQVTWLYPALPTKFRQVTDLVLETNGELNFNDALIALSCRERNLSLLASFDSDFDQIPWLRRVSQPDDLRTLTP